MFYVENWQLQPLSSVASCGLSEQGSDWQTLPEVGSEALLAALRAAMSAGGVGRTERRPLPVAAMMADVACAAAAEESVAQSLGGAEERCWEQVRVRAMQ